MQGYTRLFSQLSTDHRGTPNFPGLVATILPNSEIGSVDLDGDGDGGNDHLTCASGSNETNGCIGLAFLINSSPDLIIDLIKELDFREKAGYTRQLVTIELLQNSLHHLAGEKVDAIVYKGLSSNPNFYQPCVTAIPRGVGWHTIVDRMAAIVSTASGPSGLNTTYLFNLCKYFRSNNIMDVLTFELESAVNRRLLSLRGVAQHPQPPSSSSSSNLSACSSQSNAVVNIIGWGNENHFLKHSVPDTAQVFAGGTLSGVLLSPGGDLEVICNSRGSLGTIRGVLTCSFGHQHVLVLLNGSGGSSKLVAFGTDSYGQCSGSNSSSGAGLSCSGGNDVFISHTDLPSLVLVSGSHEFVAQHCQSDEDTNMSPMQISHIAAGVNHSAAVTADGRLLTWGDNKYLQCSLFVPNASHVGGGFSDSAHAAPPMPPVRVVQVTCGHKHTTFVDSLGRLWTMGNNKHGQLGRRFATATTSAASASASTAYGGCDVPGLVEFDEVLSAQTIYWEQVSG